MCFLFFNLPSRSLPEVNPWVHLRQCAVLRLFQDYKSFQLLPSWSSQGIVLILWSSEAASWCEMKKSSLLVSFLVILEPKNLKGKGNANQNHSMIKMRPKTTKHTAIMRNRKSPDILIYRFHSCWLVLVFWLHFILLSVFDSKLALYLFFTKVL